VAPVKIAFIGAGSVGFTRRLLRDLLAVPEFRDVRFAFNDISERNLEMVTQLCEKDIRNNNLPATITTTTDRREALRDADYVINCTRIGGLEAFALDIEIPLRYGIDQCVGDTICAGGIMYGQRNIPRILEFCRDIREVAKPEVLFLNYANPMAMNVWAALEHGGVNTIGLCHGIEHGWTQIAEVLGAERREDVEIVCAGINHQTWYTRIHFQGREVGGEELLAAFERHPKYSKTEKVRIDVLQRFGYYSTESNGHLSEYLPWYRKRPEEIPEWIDLSHWINGETGGYLRVCTEGRDWFETDFPEWLAVDDPPITAEGRSEEHASWILEGLETGRRYRGHFDVRNDGVIANLPDDCIVEVPGYADGNGISIPRVGELPAACAATCNVSVSVQRMAVEAAVKGDVTLLKQAMLHDPLIGAVCNPEEVWRMADEMLVAQAKWLPQFAEEIPAAKARIEKAEPPPSAGYEGAARLRTRSVEELRASGERGRGAVGGGRAAGSRASRTAGA
jgi:alpha-galactosidase